MMDARPLIEQFLTQEDLDALGLAIATPYKACSDFMRLSVVTSTFPIGMEQKPHLLRAFVDHSLMQMANYRSGFRHEIRWNAAYNCQHVRIYKAKYAITAHFMGRKDFRHSARHAENRMVLAARNGDLFGSDGADLDVFKDGGYVQILHGGNASPEFLVLAIPTRDQFGIGAGMRLPIPAADAVAAEQIREEMGLKLKKTEGGEQRDDGQTTG
jgi:hypothetical protein